MRQSSLRLIYGITLMSAGAGTSLVAGGVATNNPTTAIAGLSVLLVAFMAFRLIYEQTSLRRARQRIGDGERLLQAERGVLEGDIERTRRELDDQERDHIAAIANEREALRLDVEAERDRMLTEFANKKAAWQRAAFRKGFEMGEFGVGNESRSAEVIYLPFGIDSSTTMETGTMLN